MLARDAHAKFCFRWSRRACWGKAQPQTDMPVAMKSKHLIERYDSPTSIQPHGPYSANTYNPAGGAKFTPKLSPGILGSPTVSMVSPEECVAGSRSLIHYRVCSALKSSPILLLTQGCVSTPEQASSGAGLVGGWLPCRQKPCQELHGEAQMARWLQPLVKLACASFCDNRTKWIIIFIVTIRRSKVGYCMRRGGAESQMPRIWNHLGNTLRIL